MKTLTRISTLTLAGVAALSLAVAPMAPAAPDDASAPANQQFGQKRGGGVRDGSGPKRLHLRDGSCGGACNGAGGQGKSSQDDSGAQAGACAGTRPQDGAGKGIRGKDGGIGGRQSGPRDGSGPRAATGGCPNS